MTADDLEILSDRIRIAYGKAYYDFDKLLKRMELSDEQVLQVLTAMQQMMDIKEDRAVVATLLERLRSQGEGWPEPGELIEAEVTEIAERYAP